MKRTALALILISALFFSALAGTQVIKLGTANPYSQARYSGLIAPPSGTEPPSILILSPVGNEVFSTSNVTLTLDVRVGVANPSMIIDSVFYKADWLRNDIKINSLKLSPRISNFKHSLTLTGVPAGNHNITVYATETGQYYPDFFHYYSFSMSASSSVSFVVDISSDSLDSLDKNEIHDREVPPDSITNLPAIKILNPENKTAYKTRDILLYLEVNSGDSNASVRTTNALYYQTDWQPNNVTYFGGSATKTGFLATINVEEIPEGDHNLTVYVTEKRQYDGYNDYSKNLHYKVFDVISSASVTFTVDTKASKILVLSPENKTYATSEIPLNFEVNESEPQILYNLDGIKEVKINGNTTVTGLSEGQHFLTIHVVDRAGNKGRSETVFFTVEPFTRNLAASAIMTMAIGAAATGATGLAVYFKKRNRQK